MTPRVRMIAGPNGGKTTLTDLLRREINRPFELILNPDAIEKQLRESKSLAFDAWNVDFDEYSLNDAVDRHPLRARLPDERLRVERNALIFGPNQQVQGYLAAVLSDVFANGSVTAFRSRSRRSCPVRTRLKH